MVVVGCKNIQESPKYRAQHPSLPVDGETLGIVLWPGMAHTVGPGRTWAEATVKPRLFPWQSGQTVHWRNMSG